MLLVFLIYLASFVSSLLVITKLLLAITLFIFMCSLLFSIALVYEDKTKEDYKNRNLTKFYKWLKNLVISIVIMSSLIIIVPSERTIYLMAGAYIGQKVVADKNISDKLKKINKIIDYKLDDIISKYEEELK